MEVTESTCFLCHFKGTKFGRVENPIGGCGNCHAAPEGDIELEGATFNHKDFVVITSYSIHYTKLYEALDADENVDAIGINCGTGPAGVFDALQSVSYNFV